MPVPIRFSPLAKSWLDAHSDQWLRDWLFLLGDGRIDLGPPILGYQPDVHSVLVTSPRGQLLGVVVAAFQDSYTVIKFDDLQDDH